MSRLRVVIGATLRRKRQAQGRTLREVADTAGVSLTYLSEVERGRKEPSSEVLEAVCAALDLVLSELLFEVAEELARLEVRAALPRVGFVPAPAEPLPTGPLPAHQLPARPASAHQPPLVEPVVEPVVVEPVVVEPEPPVPAPVARVFDLHAYAARRSA